MTSKTSNGMHIRCMHNNNIPLPSYIIQPTHLYYTIIAPKFPIIHHISRTHGNKMIGFTSDHQNNNVFV